MRATRTKKIDGLEQKSAIFKAGAMLTEGQPPLFPILNEPWKSLRGAVQHLDRFGPETKVRVCGQNVKLAFPLYEPDDIVRND